jgi:hypothetical protein
MSHTIQGLQVQPVDVLLGEMIYEVALRENRQQPSIQSRASPNLSLTATIGERGAEAFTRNAFSTNHVFMDRIHGELAEHE